MRTFASRIPRPAARRLPVVVGPGALDALAGDLVARDRGGLVVVISDSQVAPLHAAGFAAGLAGSGLRVHVLTFPAGEVSKTRATKARLEDAMLALGAGRDAAVVAIGGGVTGDLAGFVAATFHRGVPIWQAPTTILAMADAALGGKTAVDVSEGKNLIGAFHHPEGVYADLGTLATLPEREYRAGFAEVVKTAAIVGGSLFGRLERTAARLVSRDYVALEPVLFACLKTKARIVAADERDAGSRMILNFGHTVAHALETTSGYALPHGEAVAIGLSVEAHLAVAAIGFPARDAMRIDRLLEAFGLPLRPPATVDSAALLVAARRDKKARAGRTRYALPAAIGRLPHAGGRTVEIDDALVAEALRGD